MSHFSLARTHRARPVPATLVVVLCLAVAGCGLRLETPPPEPPSPGLTEQARQRTALDARALEDSAGLAASAEKSPKLRAALTGVAAAARTHLASLGGVWADPSVSDVESAEPSGASAVPPTTTELAEALSAASARARKDAETIAEPGLSRLLFVISTARLVAADRLAGLAKADRPKLPVGAVPRTKPPGMSASTLAAIVLAEDEAGYALEVVAARTVDPARKRASTGAGTHRARAEAWATLAKISGGGLDPRRAAYALGAPIDTEAELRAIARGVEASLASVYAGAIIETDAAAREPIADLLTAAAAAAAAWGAADSALPGLESQASTQAAG